ncbi:MAG: ABC transporter permease subunit [Bacteroidota bacterium]
MTNKSETNSAEINLSIKIYIIVSFVIIYILLFEFVLTPIKFIPKPSLLFDSFISLWETYKLAIPLFATTSVIYLMLLFGSLVVTFLSKYFLKIIYEYPGILNFNIPFKYLSAFFFALVFNLWFSDSLIAEFIFAFFVVIGFLISFLRAGAKNPNEAYIASSRSIGLSNNEIYSKVIWKDLQPAVFKGLKKIHVILWSIILIYEFVGQTEGLGSVYFAAYTYNDIGAVIALGILVSLLIIFGNFVINFLIKKIIFWE